MLVVNGAAAQVFAVFPVLDLSEAERRQVGHASPFPQASTEVLLVPPENLSNEVPGFASTRRGSLTVNDPSSTGPMCFGPGVSEVCPMARW